MSKLIPHTANALSLATTVKSPVTNDNLAVSPLADAPMDGKKYVRMNGQWVALDDEKTPAAGEEEKTPEEGGE